MKTPPILPVKDGVFVQTPTPKPLNLPANVPALVVHEPALGERGKEAGKCCGRGCFDCEVVWAE